MTGHEHPGAADRAGRLVTAADAVLFDLDGVLLDSTDAVHRHWTAFARWQGFDPTSYSKGLGCRADRCVAVGLTTTTAADLLDADVLLPDLAALPRPGK